MHLPANLLRDLRKTLGIPYGKRIFSVSSLPGFLMQPTCPKSLVREFVGAMFGGDGTAPIPLAEGGWSNIRLSMCKVPLSSGDRSYHPQATEHTASIKHMFGQIKALLERFGITGLTESELRDVTNSHPDSLERPGVRVYLGVLVLPTKHLCAFHERVGFRLCAHKQQRLAVAAAYYRTKDYSREQRQRFMRRMQELTVRVLGRVTRLSSPAGLPHGAVRP